MLRLSWTQPEDLAAHALQAAREDGVDVADLDEEFTRAGGDLTPRPNGASPEPAPAAVRGVAARVVGQASARARPAALLAAEPDTWEGLRPFVAGTEQRPVAEGLGDRLRGAWLGRAVGCLMGKPVEKIPRAGIREIATSTGRWPITGYFTDAGLDPAVAERWPWNRKSRGTSLETVIDGMPEDDDLNFTLLALVLLERYGPGFTIDDVAQEWLQQLPAGRIFTAERIVLRNLLAGIEPVDAAEPGNPFVDWIGAFIRTDAYGWATPSDPAVAVRDAVTDARLTHRRVGVHGAVFVAAASSAAAAGADPVAAVRAGLAVVPPDSRFAAAVRLGLEVADGAGDDESALDVLHETYGHLHWVHTLPNAAVVALAVARYPDDLGRAVGLAIAAGWDTDSAGATVGALIGAQGVHAVPTALAAPLHGRYATTLPGFDGVRFEDLADRVLAVGGPR